IQVSQKNESSVDKKKHAPPRNLRKNPSARKGVRRLSRWSVLLCFLRIALNHLNLPPSGGCAQSGKAVRQYP
ncbi:MAG: hypothetical protein RR473_07430, partial [Comamonas sp.]